MRKTLAYRWALLGVAVGLLVGLSGCPFFVFFPDDALDSAVRASISKPFGLLTVLDLAQVTEIQASNLDIVNLEGLQYCPSLMRLNLTNNAIQSITPLTGLTNLTWLELGGNKITNIEPLAGLFFLEYLDLWGSDNDIRDWSALVANAQAGGLGAGDTVTLGIEWTIDPETETVYDEFKETYQALKDAGVDVFFAEEDGTLVK
ncbi:MAG TPA: hypothetical protein PLI09_18125 [Candidatus Hydrogenedentes bacterium]|nr:hypothetical protein [Candidatus Hydrogenedentota bacterium]